MLMYFTWNFLLSAKGLSSKTSLHEPLSSSWDVESCEGLSLPATLDRGKVFIFNVSDFFLRSRSDSREDLALGFRVPGSWAASSSSVSSSWFLDSFALVSLPSFVNFLLSSTAFSSSWFFKSSLLIVLRRLLFFDCGDFESSSLSSFLSCSPCSAVSSSSVSWLLRGASESVASSLSLRSLLVRRFPRPRVLRIGASSVLSQPDVSPSGFFWVVSCSFDRLRDGDCPRDDKTWGRLSGRTTSDSTSGENNR